MELSFLQRLALFARRRYRTVFIAFGLLLALSVVLILRLSFNTDMLSLLPQEDPAVRTYVETLQDFGSSTYLLVAIRIPEGAVVDPYETLADRLAERLASLPDLKTVQHKVGDPQELLETFYPKALLFLDEAGREKLEARLSDEGIRQPCERDAAPDLDAAGPRGQGAAAASIRSAWPTCSSAGSSPPAARSRSTGRAATTCRATTGCC